VLKLDDGGDIELAERATREDLGNMLEDDDALDEDGRHWLIERDRIVSITELAETLAFEPGGGRGFGFSRP
jgi:hypothetical protein